MERKWEKVVVALKTGQWGDKGLILATEFDLSLFLFCIFDFVDNGVRLTSILFFEEEQQALEKLVAELKNRGFF